MYQVVQASKSGKYKRRIVYCLPFKITIYELILGSKIMDYFSGNDNTALVMGHRQSDLFRKVSNLVKFHNSSGDVTAYDQTLPTFIIN